MPLIRVYRDAGRAERPRDPRHRAPVFGVVEDLDGRGDLLRSPHGYGAHVSPLAVTLRAGRRGRLMGPLAQLARGLTRCLAPSPNRRGARLRRWWRPGLGL